MKTISLLVIWVACLVGDLHAEQCLQPLPQHFDGMLPTNGRPDLYLAAIYRCKKNAEPAYAEMGTVFRNEMGEFSMLHTQHLFNKIQGDEEWAYGVRLARLGGQHFMGYITRSENLDPRVYGGQDMAISTLGKEWTSATNFSTAIPPETWMLYFPTNIVVVRSSAISNLYSYVTGREVTILGYGIGLTAEEVVQLSTKDRDTKDAFLKSKPRYIIAEFDAEAGKSGMPLFIGNRFFMLHGGPKIENGGVKLLGDYVRKTYHREPGNIAHITGSLVFEPPIPDGVIMRK